eukprot:gene23744-biopygen10381
MAARQAPPKSSISGNVAPQSPQGLATGLQCTHHIAIQDTSRQCHSTLGLVPHLMGLLTE